MIRHLPSILACCTVAAAGLCAWYAVHGVVPMAVTYGLIAMIAAILTVLAAIVTPGSSDE